MSRQQQLSPLETPANLSDLTSRALSVSLFFVLSSSSLALSFYRPPFLPLSSSLFLSFSCSLGLSFWATAVEDRRLIAITWLLGGGLIAFASARRMREGGLIDAALPSTGGWGLVALASRPAVHGWFWRFLLRRLDALASLRLAPARLLLVVFLFLFRSSAFFFSHLLVCFPFLSLPFSLASHFVLFFGLLLPPGDDY
jgi:hypothetical protein